MKKFSGLHFVTEADIQEVRNVVVHLREELIKVSGYVLDLSGFGQGRAACFRVRHRRNAQRGQRAGH